MVYLHALSELEMTTRMALVPSDWDDPRSNHPLEDAATIAPRADLGTDA